MVGPGDGALAAHLEDVEDHGVDGGVGVAPNIMENAKCADMQDSFNRKFTQKKVYGWDRGGLAEFENSS